MRLPGEAPWRHVKRRPDHGAAGLARASALLMVVAAGCRPDPTPPDPGETYQRFCAVCHGADGKAATGTDSPQLNNAGLLASASEEFLTENIARGRPGTKMSAFGRRHGGPLSDEQLAAVVRHVRSWPVEPPGPSAWEPAAGDAAAGRAIYDESCASCHGADGRSETAPDLSNPVFLATADDAFIAYAIRYGRPGTSMGPQPLDDRQIADTIAYLRHMGQSRE